MDNQIEAWRVEQFTANVYQLSQQKGSRLASRCRNEAFKGKAEFFDRLGLATAQPKQGRNSETPNLDLDHSRRMLTTVMYEWATLVDRKDKLQNIHDPESQYSIAARNALGRTMDDIIINAALGTARTLEDGSGSQILPLSQKLAAVSAGTISKLNIGAMLAAKQKLDAAEAEGPRNFVTNASGLQSLLSQTQVTSADYNSVRALVNGELDTFLGFKIIRSERLVLSSVYSNLFLYDPVTGLYNAGGTALAGNEVSSFAFVGDGIIFGQTEGMMARIDQRSDKSYDWQVYCSMDHGAVRMEEVKVVEVICSP
jgi:hypothetical protein